MVQAAAIHGSPRRTLLGDPYSMPWIGMQYDRGKGLVYSLYHSPSFFSLRRSLAIICTLNLLSGHSVGTRRSSLWASFPNCGSPDGGARGYSNRAIHPSPAAMPLLIRRASSETPL